jgi:hypothetical protein
MQIKRERLHLGGYFLEFLTASIADLITLLFSSLQNSEGGGDGDRAIDVLTPPRLPPIFTIFKGQNLTYSLSSSLLRHLAKNLQKQKSLLVNVKKIKAKKLEKRLLRRKIFTTICQKRRKSVVFWPLLRLCRYAMSKYIFLMYCLNINIDINPS